MRFKFIAVGVSAFALALAGCASSGGATPAPGTSAPSASQAATDAPTTCASSTDAAAVAVTIKDFAFDPTPVSAAVGQPIGWTNQDGAPHTATLDDAACATGTISADGGIGTLVFSVAGEYPYHCAIHPQMKGTIVVN